MKNLVFQWLGINTTEKQTTPPDINHATAALMVEVMAADDEWDETEATRIKQLLHDTLNLSPTEVEAVFTNAQQTQQKAHDLFHLTTVVNQHYTPEQKYALLKTLWAVAYADGRLDHYEEHIIRKLAELLYLTHTQFIQAKLTAQEQSVESGTVRNLVR